MVIDLLGDGNSSVLYDVAIIDENNVWAVGELYLKDSSGNMDPTPYGLAKWNGSEWSHETVTYHDFGSTTLYPGPLFAIQAFGVNDIYVCSYANLLHWDGVTWTEKAFFMTSIPFENQILRMWGRDGNSIYCVGRTGGIFYFNGTSWTRVESGTNIDLIDAFGEQESVWIIGMGLSDSRLLRASTAGIELRFQRTTGFDAIHDDTLSGFLGSVWSDDGERLLIASHSGIYSASVDTYGKAERVGFGPGLLPGYPQRIRGQKWNDVFVVGDYGMVLHYNGLSWHEYTQFIGLSRLRSLDIKGNMAVAVGEDINTGRAIAIRSISRSP